MGVKGNRRGKRKGEGKYKAVSVTEEKEREIGLIKDGERNNSDA